ncbi:hypothetical protein R6Q59_027278 [Mikania micrantha]
MNLQTKRCLPVLMNWLIWAIARGCENGYVLVRRRSKTNATGVVIKVWLKCDRGDVYQGEPKARRNGSKKTGCEFELNGKYERSCGGWKLRVVNSEHNHQVGKIIK